MVTILLLSLVDIEKNTRFAGHLDDHADALVRCGASPDGAQPGLHAEPLDVAIGRLLSLYRPGASAMVIDGGDTTNTIK